MVGFIPLLLVMSNSKVNFTHLIWNQFKGIWWRTLLDEERTGKKWCHPSLLCLVKRKTACKRWGSKSQKIYWFVGFTKEILWLLVILPFMTFRINFQSQCHHFNKEKKNQRFPIRKKRVGKSDGASGGFWVESLGPSPQRSPGVKLSERPGLDLPSLSKDINVVFERELKI